MEVFNYEDYIKAIHTFRLNAVMKLAECSQEEYFIQTKQTKDEKIKEILNSSKEITAFLNAFIELKKKLNYNDMILYKGKKIKLKDTEILYKLKKQETFFLIYYETDNDINFPYRLLNLCIDIIQEWTRNIKTKEIKKYPQIIPIVIYVGKEKWKLPKKIKAQQLEKTTYGENRLNLRYNLIDINKITNKELILKNTMLSKALLIKKLKIQKNEKID